MTISINDTRDYHTGERASLGWEQTISECLISTSSAYMQALKVKRAYGDFVCDFLREKSVMGKGGKGASLLEVGGGYGNLAAHILTRFDDITMTLVDISPVFSSRQRETLSQFADRVKFVNSDIFDFLRDCPKFDLIIANEIMGDLPAIMDVEKGKLEMFIKTEEPPDEMNSAETGYLIKAREFIEGPGISLKSAPDVIHLNTGAVEFIERAMDASPALWIVEHSSDYEIPEPMGEMLREERKDLWPKKIILFGHTEVSICFEHLKRAAKKRDLEFEGGSLMEFLGVRDDNEIRYILLSGSVASETHELIGEFVNHVKEYQWLYITR